MYKGRKMRRIVEAFKDDRNIPKVRLECGHVKTDPMFYYGNEKAKAIVRLFHDVAGTFPKTPCHDCQNLIEKEGAR